MNTNRIAAGVLTLFLLALLGWSVFPGVGDIRTWLMLGVGVGLGGLYTIFGKLPQWVVLNSGGSVTDDNDPSNIPVLVYMPILHGVIVAAVLALVVGGGVA